MHSQIQTTGVGHYVGSQVVSNRELALSLKLEPDWFEKRTGVLSRHVCAENEDVLSLAVQAVKNACADARLDTNTLGHETVFIHIQNGMTHLTPPAGILLCGALGFDNVRTLSIDGVCSEVINAIEIADLMLSQRSCSRVIISAAVDFLPIINPNDKDTVGLFGAGAGAMILESRDGNTTRGLKGIYWETQSKYWQLGFIPILGRNPEADGLLMKFGYYQMRGSELAKVTLKSISRVVDHVLKQADWRMEDIDFIVTHQPNVKMLELGIKKLAIPSQIIDIPGKELGNMGPASLLIALSLAKEKGKVRPLSKVLLISFGLGFSCGGAALVL